MNTENLKIFMVLLGCKPENRNTEQHDIFFGIAETLKDLIPAMKKFWPDGKSLHIDAYKAFNTIDNYRVIISEPNPTPESEGLKLFFINFGGYKENEFEEYHRKILVVAKDIGEAIAKSKHDKFYTAGQHLSPAGRSHIDDKMEVEEIICLNTLFPQYKISITKDDNALSAYHHTEIRYIPFSRLFNHLLHFRFPIQLGMTRAFDPACTIQSFLRRQESVLIFQRTISRALI